MYAVCKGNGEVYLEYEEKEPGREGESLVTPHHISLTAQGKEPRLLHLVDAIVDRWHYPLFMMPYCFSLNFPPGFTPPLLSFQKSPEPQEQQQQQEEGKRNDGSGQGMKELEIYLREDCGQVMELVQALNVTATKTLKMVHENSIPTMKNMWKEMIHFKPLTQLLYSIPSSLWRKFSKDTQWIAKRQEKGKHLVILLESLFLRFNPNRKRVGLTLTVIYTTKEKEEKKMTRVTCRFYYNYLV